MKEITIEVIRFAPLGADQLQRLMGTLRARHVVSDGDTEDDALMARAEQQPNAPTSPPAPEPEQGGPVIEPEL